MKPEQEKVAGLQDDLKRSNEELGLLRLTSDRYRAIVESSEDAIISKDLDGIITSWNRGAELIFGWTAAEILGKSVRILIPNDLQQQEDEILDRLRKGERIDHFETVRLRKDGTRVELSITVSPIKDMNGVVVGASKVARDITTQLQSAAVRNTLSAIVESSDDAIVSKDLQGIITSWNKGAERLFGYTAEEAVGRSVLMLIPDELHQEEAAILARLRQGDRVDHFETQRMHKDGHLLDLSLTISPIRDARGRIVGASKVARDISTRKLGERILKENDRRKDEFLATLSHELRSPLAPLTNALQLLEAAPDDPAISSQARAVMGRQLQQLVHLVDDLMDLSRVSRGVIELRKMKLDIRTVLVQAVEGTRPLIDEQGHVLRLELAPAPLWVDGDPTRLVQVFSNFLNNAAKYTDPGGRITMKSSSQGGWARIEVSDTGIGIEPAQLEAIFEMFAQLEPASTRKHGGLGIGLSIVKQLVGLHGGTLRARSGGIGKGSTFIVELPLVAAPTENAGTGLKQDPKVDKLRILVTDDNVETAVSLSSLLRRMGHEVHAANNGRDAIVETTRFHPQVIFLDIGMPGMDGYETCRNIRQESNGTRPFMIALTGWGQDEDKRLAREAGFDLHLTKPMGRSMLQESLEKAHEKLRTARPAN